MKDIKALSETIQPRYPELAGQVAIVTGSGRGIGLGIALRLAKEGMSVVINDLTPEVVTATAAEFEGLDAEILAIAADMSRSADIERLFEQTLNTYGRVDVLVNNAADLRRVNVFDVDQTLLDNQIANNIRGPYLCTQRAAEIMREGGGGNIISISSVGGLRAHWRGLPYDVTKGALDAMTRAMALELAAYGVRVNAVAPGATFSERWSTSADEKTLHDLTRRIPLNRFGTALEIGAAVSFLASADATYITGQVLYVDGGLTVQLAPKHEPI